MPDKAKTKREAQGAKYVSFDVQKDVNEVEHHPQVSGQDWLKEPYYYTKFIRWPLLLGSGILVVLLLVIGYFYGSGVVDELSSIVLAVVLTLIVAAITAIFWWLKSGR